MYLPEAGPLHGALGLILAERGNYDEAAKRLGRAVDLLPDDARIHYNLALALERLERSDAAEGSLRNAMRLAPNDPDVFYALAFHDLKRGRLDDAEALDRIRFDRTHIVGPIEPVNPVYIYKVEQIHTVDGIADGDSHQPRSALDTPYGSRLELRPRA